MLAVDKAEDGANFLEVFEWFRTEGYDEEVCFANTYRVFRGGIADGGAPFTKDISYVRGFIEGMRGSFRFPVDRQRRLYQEAPR